jgi:hypothetical protein
MVKLNKKSQSTILFIFMIGLVCFILGMALTPALKETITENTTTETLNCSASDLTTIQKSVCTQEDMFIPLFVGLCFGLAGLIIGGMAVS